MNSVFSVKGTSGILELLECAGEKELHSAAVRGACVGLDRLCEAAKNLCPSDTGTLRDSIAVRMNGNGGEVYAGAPHAVHVEMGTAQRPAQPFLYPALCAGADDIWLGVYRSVARQVNRKE